MYHSVDDAAAKWGVSPRQVQRLLAAGRVPLARKIGRVWMIPAEAEKPGDPRRTAGRDGEALAAELTNLYTAITAPAPSGNPDGVLDACADARQRLLHEGALAYARGDFARSMDCFRRHEGDAARLSGCAVAIASAIGAGDYAFYLEVEGYLKDIIRRDISCQVTAFAELSLCVGYLGAMAPDLAPDWLKNGAFSALPEAALPEAAHMRALYFQCVGDHRSMLAVAETALNFGVRAEGMTFPNTYLRLSCAIACHALGREEDAARLMLGVMRDNLPHGFLTPIAETMPQFGGLVEQLLRREFPAQTRAVFALSQRAMPNWLSFHNRFTRDNITLILPLRDYQMARMVAKGVPYPKIAEQFHISEGRLKNLMQEVCEKLHIVGKTRSSELAKYIL